MLIFVMTDEENSQTRCI